ncbi:MAG: AI-2E family transporter [Clostridia bacterium]|nr:AI-2E family transporter [Clostridia bacterium]
MQLRVERPRRRGFWILAGCLAAVLAVMLLWRPLAQVLALTLTAAALCFVAAPLARLYERRLSRPVAALACLLSFALAIAGLAWMLLPALLRELFELARTLPSSIGLVAQWLGGARGWLEGHLPGVALPELDLSALSGALSGLASGTISLAANLADVAGRASMLVVLAYFFLRDRDSILLRLELLLPQSFRPTAVRMAGAACRELRLYLQGQLMIAGAVALLSIAALMIVGVRSALVLGLLVGILNMIPYFGPFIGGVPAVLIALSDGWQKAALTVLALTVVQQLDGSLISPRIMGGLTGFSPALVLVGIYAGARVGGVLGMLLALPVMMTVRTLFRVFVQKYENI